ncbi:hypothetical protein PF008_g11517 [Phytophthora fragariae]|uniref:Uncharacterized protein n=1 Tax=Phytophthora fragariae TaxID=53985 RepID=A0A6G0RR32_9STRA|nr:hypothetical protein PF008_g11517 [Phytophthora fragariae]
MSLLNNQGLARRERCLLLLELVEYQPFLLLKSLEETFSFNMWVAFSLHLWPLASRMLVFK